MSAQDRAIQKLARELAGIKREVTSRRGPQLDYSSIENSGNFTFKDSDGNVTAVVGGQDDGSNTIRHVDGPVPPIPSGLSAHVDGPIIQVSWDGTFEDADNATYDWSHLEVIAVGPNSENLRGTISDATGASTNLAATSSGEWTVAARSVSRAEKRSLDGDAGTVDVKLVDIDGAIEAVQDSANGKNKVTYSEHAPTPADPGIFDDTWFVGQVGRPDDVVEATNLLTNPSFENGIGQVGMPTLQSGATATTDTAWAKSGSKALKLTPTGAGYSQFYPASYGGLPVPFLVPGKTYTFSATIRLATAQTGTIHHRSRKITIGTRDANNNATYDFAVSNQAPNAPGVYRLSVTASIPADYLGAFLMLGNGSDYEPVWFDDMAVVEGTTDGTYFDGDTPSGTTDNESHYRWTGTPHASTSEKYLPALTIGESDTWNVIEQYRHDGTSWVRVELSHKVFSTVDLGKATVGELDGIRIMGQTIRGEQLSGDAIDGKVITGPIIQSARTGQRWVGDTTGIRIFNADNEVRTQLSPDGSAFKGEVEADTLVVNGGSELRSTENKLAQGAKLTLEAGVTDPTAPLTVQPYWDSLEFEISSQYTNVGGLVGLAYDGTHYWSAHKDDQGVRGQRARIYAVRIDPDTGVGEYVGGNLVGSGAPWSSEVFGVTCVGSELFWLGRSLYDGYVWVTDLAGEFKRAFAYPNLGYSSSNPLGYKPGIGNDGTNVVIAHCSDVGALFIRTFNKTTGALISTINDPTDATRSDITGVYVGNADWGRKLVTVAKASTSKLPSFSATTGAYDGVSTKFSAASPESTGVVYVDGKFRTLDPSGVIHEYADANTGDSETDWWATYRWSVDVDEDGINDSVSRIGPVKRFTWPRRGKLKLLGAPLPVGAGYITPSIAKKATTPVRNDFRTPGFSVNVGESVAFLSVLPTDWLSGGNPGDANTFPEAESSVLTTASNTFRLQGDGSGYWGPLKMGRNGVMSGLIVSGQTLVQLDQNGVTKQFTINFPAGRFTKRPRVWVQISTAVPDTTSAGVIREEITANSFNLHFYRNNTTVTGVTWFAMDSE